MTALIRSRSVRAGIAQRARIIVLASEGESNTRIAELVGVTRQTVITWRARYDEAGMNGLVDEPRSGVSAHDRSPPDRVGNIDAAAEEARRHPLEYTFAGRSIEDQQQHRCRCVA